MTDCTLTEKYFYEGDWKTSAIECQIIIISGNIWFVTASVSITNTLWKRHSSFYFLPYLHFPLLYSSFWQALSFVFSSPVVSSLLPYFLSFQWHCTQLLKHFSHLCPSVILFVPPHIFAPYFFLPPLKPHSSFFIFSLNHIAFTLSTPYTHILSYNMDQIHMVFRSDHIQSLS